MNEKKKNQQNIDTQQHESDEESEHEEGKEGIWVKHLWQ